MKKMSAQNTAKLNAIMTRTSEMDNPASAIESIAFLPSLSARLAPKNTNITNPTKLMENTSPDSVIEREYVFEISGSNGPMIVSTAAKRVIIPQKSMLSQVLFMLSSPIV
jgi:hypothetical protein